MLVLGWVTAEEHLVLLALAGRFASPVIPCVREAKSHKTERVSLKKESALIFW